MELQANAIVAGWFAPPAMMQGPQGASAASSSSIQAALPKIFTKVASRGYQGFQLNPTSTGGAISGPAGMIVVEPPLIQVQMPVELTVSRAAEDVKMISEVVQHELMASPLSNLGVRIIYNAEAPNRNAPDFMVRKVMAHDDPEHFGPLLPAGAAPWCGVKFRLPIPTNGQGTLTIEPLLADPGMLYVDLDVQYPGVFTVQDIRERVTQVEQFVQTSVKPYLDQASESEGGTA